MRDDRYREVPLTLAVALALWAGAVAAGTQAGVFLRLGTGAYAALAAFATFFSVSVAIVDERVRGWFGLRARLAARLAAAAVAVLLAVAGVGYYAGGAFAPAAAPWAPMLLFGVPVTAALCVTVLLGLASRARTSPRARPPASTAPASRRGGPSATRTSAPSRAAAAAQAGG